MRKVFLAIGIICLGIGCISYNSNPDRMYATRPYGKGIVRETNHVAKAFSTAGVICIGIWGCMKFFGGEEK